MKASDVVRFPFVGPSASLEKIKNQRDQVKRLIRAEIEALRFIRERKEETVALISKIFRLDEAVAQKSYDFSVSFFSKDARIDPEEVKRLIALEKEAGDISGGIPVSRVADLALVDEVQREQAGR